jgi:hypothetical protein
MDKLLKLKYGILQAKKDLKQSPAVIIKELKESFLFTI